MEEKKDSRAYRLFKRYKKERVEDMIQRATDLNIDPDIFKSLCSKYMGIIQRCFDPRNAQYNRYGGRGIRLSGPFIKGNGELSPCEYFVKWALETGYTPELTLDRIDNDGDYTPENCRWATKFEQAANMSTTRFITIGDVTKSTGEWQRYYGVSRMLYASRTKRGWSPEEALMTPKVPLGMSRKDIKQLRATEK